MLSNNELGFREEDVRAVCNVSKSTKGKGGAGYIGQKGIGFKSVFSVSDYPEIHSNGYHFNLDIEHKVIPHQIELKDVHKCFYKHKEETCIFLPLNQKMREKTQHLSNKFDDISPMLLLFLNKLRKLTIIDKLRTLSTDDSKMKNQYCKTIMERTDYPENGVVELRTVGNEKNMIEKYVVLKKRLNVDKSIARDQSALTTDLAIAFALPNTQNINDNSATNIDNATQDNTTADNDLSNFPVFSYLPVQPYGFRFILQGDFVLSNGRESITTDSSWNEFLKSHIPTIFLEAVEKAKQSDSPLTIQLVLDALPSESDVFSFFKSSVNDYMCCC